MIEIENLNFDEKGLIPAVVQSVKDNEVLMVAYMNREAIIKTLETQRAWFYSRKRKKLWQKGETSGNFLDVKQIFYDCDEDTLLIKALPYGPCCHTGRKTCFFRSLGPEEKADDINPDVLNIFEELENLIDSRFVQKPEGSYITKLFLGGRERILKKIGEEAAEVIIASMSKDKTETIYESADLLFHLLIALRLDNISLKMIAQELKSRRK